MANGAPTVSNGLVISGVTTSTNVSVASSVTATTYYGSGANLTNITQTTINNNADNRVITGSNTSNTLEGESNVVINGGKLGIGVASPAQLIEVHGASNPAVLVQDTTNNCISYMYSQDSVATFGSASNHPVVFNVNNGEKLRIDSSGYLSFAGDTDTYIHHPSANQLFFLVSFLPTPCLGNEVPSLSHSIGHILKKCSIYDLGPNLLFNVN